MKTLELVGILIKETKNIQSLYSFIDFKTTIGMMIEHLLENEKN